MTTPVTPGRTIAPTLSPIRITLLTRAVSPTDWAARV